MTRSVGYSLFTGYSPGRAARLLSASVVIHAEEYSPWKAATASMTFGGHATPITANGRPGSTCTPKPNRPSGCNRPACCAPTAAAAAAGGGAAAAAAGAAARGAAGGAAGAV